MPALHLASHRRSTALPAVRRAQRRAQFLAGKQLATELLTQRGYAPNALQRRDDRWEIAHDPPRWFSLSHAGPWTLCALDEYAPCGIDIECTERVIEHLYAAEHFMHPRSFAALKSIDAAARPAAFFQLWTALEAYGKIETISLNQALAQDIFFKDGMRPPQSTHPEHRFFSRWFDATHLCTLLCHTVHAETLQDRGWSALEGGGVWRTQGHPR